MSDIPAEQNPYPYSKIFCITSDQTDEVFIGATTNTLAHKLWDLKRNFRYLQEGKEVRYSSAFEILKFPDAKIELLESYACLTKFELGARTNYWIQLYGDRVINKAAAQYETRYEYDAAHAEEHKTAQKQWYQEHKDEKAQYNHDYAEKNKEYLQASRQSYYEHNKDVSKKYYEDNKEWILEMAKQYKEDNKDKIKESRKAYNEAHKNDQWYCDLCCISTHPKRKAKHETSQTHKINVDKELERIFA